MRWRGVMEKCTYCIQRISAARITAEKQNRRIREGEVRTACQEACPAEAIVFGGQRRAGRPNEGSRPLPPGHDFFFACCFLGVKGLEYHEDLEEHLWPGAHFNPELPPQAQIFWFLYWAMTGLHALHVTIGVGVLSVIAGMAWRRRFSAQYYNPVDISALYWHFMDIVWIWLYPLLYLISRR